jgi:glucosylglycerate synthase
MEPDSMSSSFSSFESLNLSPPSSSESRPQSGSARFLICLPVLPLQTTEEVLTSLASAFSPDDVVVTLPGLEQEPPHTPLPLVSYEGGRGQSNLVLTSRDYITAAEHAEQHSSDAVLLLGPDAGFVLPSAYQQMADQLASGVDLTVPTYTLGLHDGLVNSALIYPVTRALFATNIRFPLAADAAMSRRMATRMASAAQRQAGAAQGDALVWPVTEAAVSGYSIRQVDAGSRTLPPSDGSDFNALFTEVSGSLFADVEAKATFWQRARTLTTSFRSEPPPQPGTAENPDDELPSMVEAFRLAHSNLQEIWSLVLPPQSLLALKKLSLSEPAAFTMAPALWARIVYDFALAFHLRSLNRGHLLGAFTPLYLAWVASTIRIAVNDIASAKYLEETALAFEHEKPYLLARWRWPDRFNP